MNPLGLGSSLWQLGRAQVTTPPPWWLSGGISAANAKRAYRAKGAASYAASLTNLANPGTGNATAIGSPQWDGTNGWKFPDSGGTGMLTGLNLAGTNKAWSILIRWSNPYPAAGTGWLFGAVVNQYVDSIGVYYHATGPYGQAVSSGWKGDLSIPTGVVGVAGNKGYANGSEIGTLSNGSAINAALTDFAIGGRWNGSAFTAIRQMYCQAFAAYDTVLTPAQVSAVTTAMLAL